MSEFVLREVSIPSDVGQTLEKLGEIATRFIKLESKTSPAFSVNELRITRETIVFSISLRHDTKTFTDDSSTYKGTMSYRVKPGEMSDEEIDRRVVIIQERLRELVADILRER